MVSAFPPQKPFAKFGCLLLYGGCFRKVSSCRRRKSVEGILQGGGSEETEGAIH